MSLTAFNADFQNSQPHLQAYPINCSPNQNFQYPPGLPLSPLVQAENSVHGPINYHTLSNQRPSMLFCRCPKSGRPACRQPPGCDVIDLNRPTDFTAMECTNKHCQFNFINSSVYFNDPLLVHRACISQLEGELVPILKNSTSTVGYSDRDRKARLWEYFHNWIDDKRGQEFADLVKCFNCPLYGRKGYLKLNKNFRYSDFMEFFNQVNMKQASKGQGSQMSQHPNKPNSINTRQVKIKPFVSSVHVANNSTNSSSFTTSNKCNSSKDHSIKNLKNSVNSDPTVNVFQQNVIYNLNNSSKNENYNNNIIQQKVQQHVHFNEKDRILQSEVQEVQTNDNANVSNIVPSLSANAPKKFLPKKLPQVWKIRAIPGSFHHGSLYDVQIDEIWNSPEFEDTSKLNSEFFCSLPINSEIDWLQAKQRQAKKRSPLNAGISNQELANLNVTQFEAMTNIYFPPRPDFNDFKKVIATKNTLRNELDTNLCSLSLLNPYNIMMETAEGSQANSFGVDHLRTHILSNLSQCHCKKLPCVLCEEELEIFQQFPLLAGLMYLSSESSTLRKASSKKVQLENDGQHYNLHAICIKCCQSYKRQIKCQYCFKPWSGRSFQLGTLYMHDVFACFPCCEERLACRECHNVIIDLGDDKSFSSFSDEIVCPHCCLKRHHFLHSPDTYFVEYE